MEKENMKYEDNFEGNQDRTLRIYPGWNWDCRKDKQVRICPALNICLKYYPNLICERGFREKI